MKNMRSRNSLFEKNPKVFEPLLFFSNSLEDIVRISKVTGTPVFRDNLSLKSHFRTWEQPFAIHFLLVGCNACPVAIPEICAQTQGSDYRQLIHWEIWVVVVSVFKLIIYLKIVCTIIPLNVFGSHYEVLLS